MPSTVTGLLRAPASLFIRAKKSGIIFRVIFDRNMKQYYTHDGERILGPYEVSELKNLQINASTPIWYEGLADWTTAGNVPALIPYLTLSSGPPPIKKHSAEPILPNQQPGYEIPAKRGFGIFWIVLISLFALASAAVIWYLKQPPSEPVVESTESKTQDELDKEFIASQEREERRLKEQAIFMKKQKHRKNWKRYLKVEATFAPATFLGGLENIKVRVKNSSEYQVDRVQVKVNYIKKNGEVWDSEHLILTDIAAKATKEIDAPESLRGKTVEVIFTSIRSEEMNFCYPNGGKDASADDPHYCK